MIRFPLRALKSALEIESSALEGRIRQFRSQEIQMQRDLEHDEIALDSANQEIRRLMDAGHQQFHMLLIDHAAQWANIAAAKVEKLSDRLRAHAVEQAGAIAELNQVRARSSVIERKYLRWQNEQIAAELKASERETDEIFCVAGFGR